VISGSKDKPALAAWATNTFHFVIATDKPFTTTNPTAKVTFNRVVLEGGKLADAARQVTPLPRWGGRMASAAFCCSTGGVMARSSHFAGLQPCH
jgi:hypothetical protein